MAVMKIVFWCITVMRRVILVKIMLHIMVNVYFVYSNDIFSTMVMRKTFFSGVLW